MADATAPGSIVREALTTILPQSQIEVADATIVRSVPGADCVVIDAVAGAASGLDNLRRLRALGYEGGVVLVVDSETRELKDAAARLGATRVVAVENVVRDLTDAIAGATRRDEREAPVLRALRRTQQLIAAGEIALRLQHAVNNPLAALLAEAQLLEMEALPAEHAESVRRIVEHTRRVIDVVRALDGVGGARDIPAAAPSTPPDSL
jgi:signal transduction histidine kinase